MLSNIGGTYKPELYNIQDNHAVVRFMNNVLSDMDPLLTSRQLTELNNVLQKAIKDYSISSDGKLYVDINYKELNDKLLTQFLEDKRLAGLSEKTLTQYRDSMNYIFDFLGKGCNEITADDIRLFFECCIDERRCALTTVDNYRRYMNSFYNYCVANGLLYKNPVLKLERIKQVKKIKQPFTVREIIYLRENIDNLRDKAIFELLLSSGMRVGELVQLDYKDINFNDCTLIVHGKGDKEREVFFNELAKVSMHRYLKSRRDDNPALFVSHNRPHTRATVSLVEGALRKLGNKTGIHVHPHKFRRHFATTLVKKGVQIEQVQKLLGHAMIETTQMYVVSNEDEIQYNHKRYVN